MIASCYQNFCKKNVVNLWYSTVTTKGGKIIKTSESFILDLGGQGKFSKSTNSIGAIKKFRYYWEMKPRAKILSNTAYYSMNQRRCLLNFSSNHLLQDFQILYILEMS